MAILTSAIRLGKRLGNYIGIANKDKARCSDSGRDGIRMLNSPQTCCSRIVQ